MKRSLRIAIIAPPWVPVPPPAYGGTETVLDTLSRGLRDDGHEVLLFATGDSTCEVPTRWARRYAAGTDATTPATELQHVVLAYREVLDWGADVVHDHTLCGPLLARHHEVRAVTTNHGPFDGELGVLYREISPSVPVIAISAHQASSAVDTHVAAIIHHGVDVDRFPVGRGAGGYAVFLGRMNADKGVARAVRVARQAGVRLRIAAKMREPAELAYFEREVSPLLGGGVEYIGEVGGREKLDLLGNATCLLNPIEWPEPFGMVMVEALACGTPVVATACGAVPEIVIDGGTGFVCADDDQLADALRRAGDLDRGLCRKDAAERFSAQRMVAEHVEVYESVAEGRALRVA
jgi:glycosyltransferase involved in cell wall biosynthesis